MKWPPGITFWRRLTQLAFLVLLVYGGVIFRAKLIGESVLPPVKPPEGAPSTTRFQPGQILWAADDKPVVDSYPPGAACRFNPKGGLVKACIVHFISENLTWRTAFKYFLPHVLFFLLLAFLVGRWWCGWACPLGTIGDVLTWLRMKLGLAYFNASARLRRRLRWGAYGQLGGTFAVSWIIGLKALAPSQCKFFLPYCQICPARLICPLFGGTAPMWRDFTNGVAAVFTVTAWVVLGIFMMAFVLGRRIWCHICPIGLMTSWFNRGGGLTLKKREARHCNRCGSCADACPMSLTHVRDAKEPKTLNTPECIFCLRCVESCPRDNCLELSWFGKRLARSSLKCRPPEKVS